MAPDSRSPADDAADVAIDAISVLADELRRRIYAFVRGAHQPVSREEAAADAGISVKLAAFHLDKLVAGGLLAARYDNRGVRRVGRRPKVYEPTTTHIRISIPERRPDILAEILLDAVLTEEPTERAQAATLRTARRHGRELGAAERARSRPGRLGPERSLTLTHAMLVRLGFEPHRLGPTRLCLLNCPFHPLASRAPELVCGINHAFVDGFLVGLKATGIDAALAPQPGRCCVELRAAGDDQANTGGRVDQPGTGEPPANGLGSD
jgi:predicted ArsR family transcriptional regulator